MEKALIGRDMLTFSVAEYDYDDSDTTLRLEKVRDLSITEHYGGVGWTI
jgi:hypothetical protein